MIEGTGPMTTPASFTSTVGVAGFEVPVWVFLVASVLLVLGGVAAILARRADEEGRALRAPVPATATVLFVVAAVVFLPPFAVLLQAAI